MAMHDEGQRTAETSEDVPANRVERTGESLAEAPEAVSETAAGLRPEELTDGHHPDEGTEAWQEALERKRARELDRERAEERNRARIAAAWKPFIQAERRELELRKDGQLAQLLGDPLPGEPPEALRHLASEDRRQAEQELVALTSNGKVFYKRVDELSPEDMPARSAAKRLRTTWLKERSDRWLGRGEVSP